MSLFSKAIHSFSLHICFVFFASIGTFASTTHAEITGAGSSLAYPVMKELTAQYQAQKKIEIKYSSVGSGQGIVQMAARAVDFSLSDIPLTQYELNAQNLVQFPVFASAIVPAFHLPNMEQKSLVLDGPVLADIYLGRITQWNDRAIQALNPAVSLPNMAIKVIYRSDISGSSYVFTKFLSNSSMHWNSNYGIGSKLRWPAGEGVKGSVSVEQAIKMIPGAIGYLEYGSASAANLNIANLLINGKIILANKDSFAQAFDIVGPVRPSFYQFSYPVSNLNAWPIIAVTYALVSKKPNVDDEVKESLQFFYWVYQNGASIVKTYSLLPVESKKTLASIETQWRTIMTPSGKGVWSGGVER